MAELVGIMVSLTVSVLRAVQDSVKKVEKQVVEPFQKGKVDKATQTPIKRTWWRPGIMPFLLVSTVGRLWV